MDVAVAIRLETALLADFWQECKKEGFPDFWGSSYFFVERKVNVLCRSSFTMDGGRRFSDEPVIKP